MPSPAPRTITVLPGDGIGPEVTGAAMRIVDAAGARVQWAEHVAGAKAFERGISSGVPPETVDSITRTRVVLKGPLATPLGQGAAPRSFDEYKNQITVDGGNLPAGVTLHRLVDNSHGQ